MLFLVFFVPQHKQNTHKPNTQTTHAQTATRNTQPIAFFCADMAVTLRAIKKSLERISTHRASAADYRAVLGDEVERGIHGRCKSLLEQCKAELQACMEELEVCLQQEEVTRVKLHDYFAEARRQKAKLEEACKHGQAQEQKHLSAIITDVHAQRERLRETTDNHQDNIAKLRAKKARLQQTKTEMKAAISRLNQEQDSVRRRFGSFHDDPCLSAWFLLPLAHTRFFLSFFLSCRQPAPLEGGNQIQCNPHRHATGTTNRWHCCSRVV